MREKSDLKRDGVEQDPSRKPDAEDRKRKIEESIDTFNRNQSKQIRHTIKQARALARARQKEADTAYSQSHTKIAALVRWQEYLSGGFR